MPAGFYLLIATQFLSSLADNALLIIAIALLRAANSPFPVALYVATAAVISTVAAYIVRETRGLSLTQVDAS